MAEPRTSTSPVSSPEKFHNGDSLSTTNSSISQPSGSTTQSLPLSNNDILSTTNSSIPQSSGSPTQTSRLSNNNTLKFKERPNAKNTIAQHLRSQQHPKRQINIHEDGCFMSSLRAIHSSDSGTPIVHKRRANVNINGTTEQELSRSTLQVPAKDSVSAGPRRPRRKLQRSRAFSIDRSPSPGGKIWEVNAGSDAEDDELCSLFKNTCGGFGED